MRQMTDNRHSFVIVTVTLAALLAALVLSGPAAAKTKKYTKTADYCTQKQPDGSDNPCGGIAYGNGGGYVVTRVTVKARSSDNQKWDNNPNCAGLELSSKSNLALGDYGVFKVPASCSYKLTIKILAGESKSQHVFVTPGCAIGLESVGTTQINNKPNVKTIEWADKAKVAFDLIGINIRNEPVYDKYWHEALGQNGVIHYCNQDGKADKTN